MNALLMAALLAAPGGPSEARAPVTPEARTYRAVRAVDPIVVDGVADEKTWALTEEDDRFRERSPQLGQAAPVRTTLRVAYDDQALYVFIDAHAEPGDVVVRTLRRDNRGIFSDDAVYVKLDPAFNRRSGYSFGVNADGAQIDALGLQDGRDFIVEWDGVWTAETVRRDDGYTVEFRIPFAVLGIKSINARTMGLNISRDHPSRNATYDWRVFVPPRSPMAASQFGRLEGIEDIQAGRAIEFTPYALMRTNFERGFSADPVRRPNLATGADMRLQVGAGSYAEGSFLTDFAQVEADAVQVARNRFPLFFPERRPFFINGLDVFNFGRSREAQLFFSRRIGLSGGSPVPILGGAKVYGRSGAIQYGILQVQTMGSPEDPARGVSRSDPENFSVARVRVQATRSFNVGMMLLGRHRFGVEDQDDASGGVDAQLISPDGKFSAYGFLAGTWAENEGDDPERDDLGTITSPGRDPRSEVGSSSHAAFEYRGLYVRPSVWWLWSDDDFDPRMGFYRRTAASRQEARINFAPRPRTKAIRDVTFGPRYNLETTPDYDARLGQSAAMNVQVNWSNGANVGNEVGHFFDDVQNDFTLYGHTVDAGEYRGLRNRVFAGLPGRRVLGGGVSYEFLQLFGGYVHQPNANLTVRAGKHFTLGANYTHLVGELRDAGETFNFGFANGNVDVAITRNLAFDNLVRLDLSPASERIGFQSRFRWRFLPGSDVFVVYRNDLPLGAGPPDITRQAFHQVTVKVAYYLRSFVGGRT